MQSLDTFKKAQEFTAHFVFGDVLYQVRIETPDLSGSEARSWGDWGPMHTLILSEGESLRLTYASSSRDQSVTYEVRPRYVELCTPMFARDREQFPVYLEFEDEDRCLRFVVYFDHKGEAKRSEIERTHPDVVIDELIFGHLPKQKLSA